MIASLLDDGSFAVTPERLAEVRRAEDAAIALHNAYQVASAASLELLRASRWDEAHQQWTTAAAYYRAHVEACAKLGIPARGVR